MMEEILDLLIGTLSHYFQVVQDFFHQQYYPYQVNISSN